MWKWLTPYGLTVGRAKLLNVLLQRGQGEQMRRYKVYGGHLALQLTGMCLVGIPLAALTVLPLWLSLMIGLGAVTLFVISWEIVVDKSFWDGVFDVYHGLGAWPLLLSLTDATWLIGFASWIVLWWLALPLNAMVDDKPVPEAS